MKRRYTDFIAFFLMMVSLVGVGVIYGIVAHDRSWWPMPQLWAAGRAWNDMKSEFGLDWRINIPGGRPQVSTLAAERLAPGLVMVAGITNDARNFIRIIDREGAVVHEWLPDWFKIWGDGGNFPSSRRPQTNRGAEVHGAALAKNGDLVLNFDHLSTLRLSPCGDVVWKLDNLGHHSVHFDDDGMIWASAEAHPAEDTIEEKALRQWTIQKISPDGAILDTMDVMDILRKNDLLGLVRMQSTANFGTAIEGDTLHLNDVETFPRSMTSSVFAPGDLLVSLRNINTVFVMDPATQQIKYRATGEFLRQHDPDFAGGDRIIVFDNRNLLPMARKEELSSRVVELDAATAKASVRFEGKGETAFFTDIMGKHQLLDNGNLLLTSSRQGRVLEIAPDGSLVWEYNNLIDSAHNGLVLQADVLPQSMDKRYFEQLKAKCVKSN